MTPTEIKLWVRGCLSKVRYRNQAHADRRRTRIERQRGKKFDTYYCQHCCGWHLSTKRSGT